MKDDRLYLIHIQECIERIRVYTQSGLDFFLGDTKTQDAVIRNLQTLAESSQKISQELKAQFTTIDWRALSGFRNVLVHDYLGINLDQIWHILAEDLPKLEKNIAEILASFP